MIVLHQCSLQIKLLIHIGSVHQCGKVIGFPLSQLINNIKKIYLINTHKCIIQRKINVINNTYDYTLTYYVMLASNTARHYLCYMGMIMQLNSFSSQITCLSWEVLKFFWYLLCILSSPLPQNGFKSLLYV